MCDLVSAVPMLVASVRRASLSNFALLQILVDGDANLRGDTRSRLLTDKFESLMLVRAYPNIDSTFCSVFSHSVSIRKPTVYVKLLSPSCSQSTNDLVN
jgi:hypothetical protein